MLPQFDRYRLKIKPLAERVHDLSHATLLYSEEMPPRLPAKAMGDLAELGKRLVQARERKAAVLMMMGAHVLRAGVQRPLIDLMERGLVTHIGMNGAGPIHDYELSRIGATCESVARYIRTGEFGLWRETGEINDIVRRGAMSGLGLGEAIGKAIFESDYPHKDISVLAAGYRLGIPVTVHVGIGYDILHEHPNFDPAAFGTTSYRDFLAVCNTVSKLEGGVFLCFGSAVMGPEVYLKALAMARNVAHQDGRKIANFTTAAFDLIPIDGEWQSEAPKSDPQYYYRPWKTILVRTVADGGQSFYVCGDHRQTLPHLRKAALAAMPEPKKEPGAAAAEGQKEASTARGQAASEKEKSPTPPKADKPAAGKEAWTAAASKHETPPIRQTEAPQNRKAESAVARKAELPPARKSEPPVPQKAESAASMTMVMPVRKETARKGEPAPAPKSEPAAARKSEPAAARKAEPQRKPEPSAARKSEPVLARKQEQPPAKVERSPGRKSDPPATRKPEKAVAKKSEPIAAPAPAAPPAPDTENADAAVAHYQQLKEWVRATDAEELEWYETSQKEGWHHSLITKEDYLRLYYRIVWTSGFKSRVVLAKEEEYFQIVNEVLYPRKQFNPQRQAEFLMKTASVLGGSGDNRTNKAVFQVIQLVESQGWDEFRRQYVTPSAGQSSRLKQLPLLSPKTVKIFLQQLGIADTTKDDSSLEEFAGHHGYGDSERCIHDIQVRTGDAPATIQFVIWDAGQKDALMAKS